MPLRDIIIAASLAAQDHNEETAACVFFRIQKHWVTGCLCGVPEVCLQASRNLGPDYLRHHLLKTQAGATHLGICFQLYLPKTRLCCLLNMLPCVSNADQHFEVLKLEEQKCFSSILWGSWDRRRGTSWVGFIFKGNFTKPDGLSFTQTQGSEQTAFVHQLGKPQFDNPRFNSNN